MPGIEVTLSAMAMVFGIIAFGGVLRRTGKLRPEADPVINHLILYVFYPALIASKILGSEALAAEGNLWKAPLVGAGTVGMGFALCWVVARAIRLRGREAGTFAGTTGMFNYGFIPLPLALALFDDDTVGVLFLHNIGVELMLWTVAVLLIGGAAAGGSWRKVFNPPLIAALLCVALTLLGWHRHVPAPIVGAADLLGACSIPVALLMIGALISDLLDWRLVRARRRVVVAACAARLAILPVCMLALMWFLPVSLEVKRVMAIQAAMPTAVFPVVLARLYSGDLPTAVRAVVATSLASLVTMPIWIRVGFELLARQ